MTDWRTFRIPYPVSDGLLRSIIRAYRAMLDEGVEPMENGNWWLYMRPYDDGKWVRR